MIDFVCKPIDTWPGDYTPHRERLSAPFGGGFGFTRNKLIKELEQIPGVEDVIIEIDVQSGDIRLDGLPKATAKVPPPVKVSFSSDLGPQVYAVDRYDHWHSNLHAVALTLDRLRAIERYGAVRDGQQYAGWSALPAGTPMGTTRDQAIDELVAILNASPAMVAGSFTRFDFEENPKGWLADARRISHPDAGGDHETFIRVQQLAEVLS